MSKKNSKIILIISGLALASLFAYRYFVLLPKVTKNGKYTIGHVIKNTHTMKNGDYKTYFVYYINNIKYSNTTRTNINENPNYYLNKNFLVTFLDFDYKKADISLSMKVPDSIKSAPKEGWKEIPKWAK